MEFQTLESILQDNLAKDSLEFVNRLLHGPHPPRILKLPCGGTASDNLHGIQEIKGFTFCNTDNESGPKTKPSSAADRNVRIALFQNSIVEKTTVPIAQQRDVLLELGKDAINLAAKCGVQIFCFQECWNLTKNVDMPVIFCTQKKLPWVEFAEDANDGPTTKMLCELAKLHNMVIVSPILERDKDLDCLWNTAVVINNHGQVMGISRKNHIPISGVFGESYYYNPSEIGHPVFQTDFGRIAVSICYERHHPQCFLSYGLNSAEIVFNPSATVKSFSESLWPIEARDAAFQNGFYVGAINRVGLEEFEGVVSYPYYGWSYVAGPDGSKTPGLSLDKNGLLVADLDLNKCSQWSAAERLGNGKLPPNFPK